MPTLQDLPLEILCMINRYFTYESAPFRGARDVKSLRSLRLTSSILNQAASQALFHVLIVRSQDGIQRALQLSCSRYASSFVSLSVQWPMDNLQIFLADLSRDLHLITRNLPNLTEVILVEDSDQKLLITKGAVQNMLDSLSNLFAFGRLDNVHGLYISLPVASAFDSLAKISTLQQDSADCQSLTNFMKQIQTLVVTFFPIGPGKTAADAVLYEEELSLPNGAYQEGYFNFVELAIYVEDLTLGSSTNEYLHMSCLNDRKFRRLWRLCLGFLFVTAKQIQRLILQNKQTLAVVEIFGLVVTNGTWEAILHSMMSLDQLTGLLVKGCVYHPDGDSEEFWIHPSEVDAKDMISRRTQDYDALEILCELVEQNNTYTCRTDRSDSSDEDW